MGSTETDVPEESALVVPQRPYPGMRPFGEAEWPLFFGREAMVDEVITRLVGQRLLVVHGDSGSGKSSLINAGVLPALKQQSERSAFQWRTCYAHPGGQPIENLVNAFAPFLDAEIKGEEGRFNLRRALSYGLDAAAAVSDIIRANPQNPVCLLLDQFEELFTLAPEGGTQEIRSVIGFLIGLQEKSAGGIYTVVTMQSEFLGSCAQYKDFAETVNATQYLLPRMNRLQLLRAIQEPARLCDGEVERALADCLIDETVETADQLPLIQHGLMRLHSGRTVDTGWTLTLEDYRKQQRSLADMLSDHADEIADAAEREIFSGRKNPRVVERIFSALTKINADGQPVRHPQTLAELKAITGETLNDVQAIAQRFRVDEVSFLRPFGEHSLDPGELVDLSHEALIRSWKRVSNPVDGWLALEFRSGLAWRILVEQAREYQADQTNVLSPAAAEDRERLILAHTRKWSTRYGGEWDAVKKLVSASIRAGKKTAQLRAKVGVLLCILFITATVMVVLLIDNRRKDAERDKDVAEAQTRAAELEIRVAQHLTNLAEVEGEKQLANIDILTLAALTDKAQPSALFAQLTEIATQTHSETADESSSADRNIAARVYVFISEESQRPSAQAIADSIAKLLFQTSVAVIVPKVALAKSTSRSEFRCFTETDCNEGSKLYEDVKRLITSPALDTKPQRLLGQAAKSRPRHYELWFAAGPIVPSTAVASGEPPDRIFAAPIAFSQEIVDRIRNQPGAPYPAGTRPAFPSTARKVVAIVVHDARAPDRVMDLLRTGRPPELPGPLAQWAVQSDGSIVFIADEGVKANHVAPAIAGLTNGNTIGIEATGVPALRNAAQLENLVRLLVDVADRWNIPTNLILSHGEVAVPAGRNNELLQQAPVIRLMVQAVRGK